MNSDIKPLKVCFVTTVSVTLKSFLLEFSKYAHEKYEWDITFVCAPDKQFEEDLPEYINFVPMPMGRGVNLDVFRVVNELRRLFVEERFDLVQYSTPNASLYASLAAKWSHVPVRLYCQWGMAYVGFSGVKREIFKCIEKFVCANSTWIEPDSPSNLVFAHKEGLYPASMGSVVWNGSACGVNLEKFNVTRKEDFRSDIRQAIGASEDDFVMGFVGRITRDKGINELLTAAKLLMSENEHVRLLLVGNSEIDQTIDSGLMEWANNCERVYFSGYTNCVEKYLSAMDCYVLPSYREGFGMGVVEAESMGVPVVVSDIPGPVDAMENEKSGLIVPKQDADALYQALSLLCDDKEMRSAFGTYGIQIASKKFESGKLFEMIVDDRNRLVRRVAK